MFITLSTCKEGHVFVMTGIYQDFHVGMQHVALRIGEPLELYCDAYFSKATYIRAYSDLIHPIPDVSLWPPLEVTPSSVLPPPLRRLPGRPRKNRRREADEGAPSSQTRRSSTLRCALCKQYGHNKRTCQRGPVTDRRRHARGVSYDLMLSFVHLALMIV